MMARTTAPYLIVFLDFTGFQRQSLAVDDTEIADTLDAHYQRVSRAVHAAGGRVIKFIGDATMLVFPENAVDSGVSAIFDLMASEDRLMQQHGWECRLHAKAHFGTVVAGEFGANGDRRFDVFGKAVNATARLKGTAPFMLSAEAHELLSQGLRQRFTRQPSGTTYGAETSLAP